MRQQRSNFVYVLLFAFFVGNLMQHLNLGNIEPFRYLYDTLSALEHNKSFSKNWISPTL